jgi:hypothetical protein
MLDRGYAELPRTPLLGTSVNTAGCGAIDPHTPRMYERWSKYLRRHLMDASCGRVNYTEICCKEQKRAEV